jgi:hypothetical protein
MAENNWKAVTFNEGQPFDPGDLNQLQTNLSQLFADSTILKNQFRVGTNNSILLAVGSIDGFSIKAANGSDKKLLPIDTKFGTSIPSYILSIGSPITAGTFVSVGVLDPSGKPEVIVTSNKAGTYAVNYIAFTIQ